MKNMNRHLSKEDIYAVNQQMKNDGRVSRVIRKMQIKTTLRNHLKTEWQSLKNLEITDAGEDVEIGRASCRERVCLYV